MWRERYGSKYKNKSHVYNGIAYHSKKEAGYAADLDLRKKAGDISDWTRQQRISLDVNGHHICDYFIDFIIQHNDRSIEYVEVKGFATEVWRLKWKLFEALYSNPLVRLTVIK